MQFYEENFLNQRDIDGEDLRLAIGNKLSLEETQRHHHLCVSCCRFVSQALPSGIAVAIFVQAFLGRLLQMRTGSMSSYSFLNILFGQ